MLYSDEDFFSFLPSPEELRLPDSNTPGGPGWIQFETINSLLTGKKGKKDKSISYQEVRKYKTGDYPNAIELKQCWLDCIANNKNNVSDQMDCFYPCDKVNNINKQTIIYCQGLFDTFSERFRLLRSLSETET